MRRARDRGFSLLELIAVVLIVGILSVLAVVAYRKWISTARINEATNMISNIRSAEEAFKSENGGYLPVSITYAGAAVATPTADYPALTPDAQKRNWGDPCIAGTQCVAANSWKQLAVAANGAVMYGYACVATNDPNQSPADILVNGAAQSITALKGAPWYVVEADGDPASTGKFTKIFGLSGNNELFVNEQ